MDSMDLLYVTVIVDVDIVRTYTTPALIYVYIHIRIICICIYMLHTYIRMYNTVVTPFEGPPSVPDHPFCKTSSASHKCVCTQC